MDLERLGALHEWVVARGLSGVAEGELLQGVCERLVAAGLPLRRVFVGLDTLHPIVEARGARWERGAGDAEHSEYTRFQENEDVWLRSPFHALETSGAPRLRRRLVDGGYEQGEFPLLDELRAEGTTDYLAVCTPFHESEPLGQIDSVYSSWTTDREGGFDDSDLAAIERLLPALALALKAASTAWIARSLMETYLGRDAGRRVLRGDIARGAARAIRAIIWYSDLGGFTRIADTAPRDQLIPLLNDYADRLVTAIHAHGGQVLKFMGDGLLAIFDLDDDGAACDRALDAAEHAFAGVAELNRRREEDGLPVTRCYLGLHVGEVLYGNVGSLDRLDFTVVGPAVNEASRIERMCRSLDQDLIVSSAFAEAGPGCRARLVSLGRYALRGVRRPQELFTLDPEAAGSCG